MVAWLAKEFLARNIRRLNAGDLGPILRLDADDVTMHFPGDSSWSGVHRGKNAVRLWLERFVRVGIQSVLDEVVVKGFPWRQTLCLRAHNYLDAPDGRRVYENRYVIWGRMAWGRLKEYEIYEDTQKATALDEYLAVHEERASSAS